MLSFAVIFGASRPEAFLQRISGASMFIINSVISFEVSNFAPMIKGSFPIFSLFGAISKIPFSSL
ncbi:hypothetical protein D3C87_1711360 [compost metagenome]